jgi:hypothetical protein
LKGKRICDHCRKTIANLPLVLEMKQNHHEDITKPRQLYKHPHPTANVIKGPQNVWEKSCINMPMFFHKLKSKVKVKMISAL